MQILDFSNVFYSNVFVYANMNKKLDLDGIRAMVLSSFLKYQKKNKAKYGDLILACDGKGSWRKQYFEHYKFSRSIGRDDSPLDWEEVFNIMNAILEEVEEYLPYMILKVDMTEADDIIGTLVQEFQHEKPILIVSRDHDFKQLQRYPNVSQYDPVKNKIIIEKDPERYLIEHVIRGDSGDDIPNILSDDDAFSNSDKRQKPMRKDYIKEWLSHPMAMIDFEGVLSDNPAALRNYQRNKAMIDLREIPREHREKILEEYKKKSSSVNDRSKLMGYIMKKRLKYFMSRIGEF